MCKANPIFQVWSPDEVAECMDGIYNNQTIHNLYERLWELTQHYENKQRSEVNDDFGDRCLAKFWDKLTKAEQHELNRLADLYDQKIQSYSQPRT